MQKRFTMLLQAQTANAIQTKVTLFQKKGNHKNKATLNGDFLIMRKFTVDKAFKIYEKYQIHVDTFMLFSYMYLPIKLYNPPFFSLSLLFSL